MVEFDIHVAASALSDRCLVETETRLFHAARTRPANDNLRADDRRMVEEVEQALRHCGVLTEGNRLLRADP